MNVKKRGLGRGLEVLLADTASQNNKGQQPIATDITNIQRAENLQQGHLDLLQEAENLKILLDELTDMICNKQN